MEILLNIIYYIVPFVVLLGILVFVHEFGHFIIARSVGVKVSAFSIGFGRQLCSHVDKHGTNWKISAIPLGGYCQFLGDADAASSATESEALNGLSEEDKKHAFPLQKPWKKLAIVLAGPLFNYLFAILIFGALFYAYGKIIYPPVVGGLVEGGAAQQAGIMAGDKIVGINDKETTDFQSISAEVNLATEDNVLVKVERAITFNVKAEALEPEGKKSPFKMIGLGSNCCNNKTDADTKNGNGQITVDRIIAGSPADRAGFFNGDVLLEVNGVKIQKFIDLKKYVEENQDAEFSISVMRPLIFNVALRETEYDAENGKMQKRKMLGIISSSEINFASEKMSFKDAVFAGGKEAYDLTVMTLRALGQMVVGKRGGDEVGGIIRIAEMSGDISKSGGLISFIYFMALLSVNLGLINLLPIPLLDGGHVVIFLIEMVTGREIKTQIKDIIFKIGLFVICAVMLFATWNDITHLISRWFD